MQLASDELKDSQTFEDEHQLLLARLRFELEERQR